MMKKRLNIFMRIDLINLGVLIKQQSVIEIFLST